MKKTYILHSCNQETQEKNIVATFSSYSAMVLWVGKEYKFIKSVNNNCNNKSLGVADCHKLGAVSNKPLGLFYDNSNKEVLLEYSVHDLLGEISSKTERIKF